MFPSSWGGDQHHLFHPTDDRMLSHIGGAEHLKRRRKKKGGPQPRRVKRRTAFSMERDEGAPKWRKKNPNLSFAGAPAPEYDPSLLRTMKREDDLSQERFNVLLARMSPEERNEWLEDEGIEVPEEEQPEDEEPAAPRKRPVDPAWDFKRDPGQKKVKVMKAIELSPSEWAKERRDPIPERMQKLRKADEARAVLLAKLDKYALKKGRRQSRFGQRKTRFDKPRDPEAHTRSKEEIYKQELAEMEAQQPGFSGVPEPEEIFKQGRADEMM